MNVAPGDLARVIRPHVGAGAFVVVQEFLQLPAGTQLMLPQPTGRVVAYTSCGCPCWIVKGYVHHERVGPVGPLCWVHDSMLRRVDPGDAPDESKDWLPPVPSDDLVDIARRLAEPWKQYRYRHRSVEVTSGVWVPAKPGGRDAE